MPFNTKQLALILLVSLLAVYAYAKGWTKKIGF
jgi:hypothetical protein